MVDFRTYDSGKDVTVHYSEKQGTLEYKTDGGVFARIRLTSPDKNFGEPYDMWYEGSYHIENDNTVVHSVSNSSDPDRIGKDLLRHFSFEENDLIITGKNDRFVFKIIWRKDQNLTN